MKNHTENVNQKLVPHCLLIIVILPKAVSAYRKYLKWDILKEDYQKTLSKTFNVPFNRQKGPETSDQSLGLLRKFRKIFY